MKTSCRFCGGVVIVGDGTYEVTGEWVEGFVAGCQKCGRSSYFCEDKETALRSMCINLDEGMGRGLAADLLQTLRQARKFLPPFASEISCNITARIADLDEYFEANAPNPRGDFKVGDRVMLHRCLDEANPAGPFEVLGIKHYPTDPSLAWLKGIRGGVPLAHLSIYVPLEGEK